MEAIVERLDAAMGAMDWEGRDKPPALRPAASGAEIAALEAQWGRKLPPSFEAFLRIANGMQGMEHGDWGIVGATEPDQLDTFADIKAGFVYAFRQKDADSTIAKELESTQLAGADFDRKIAYFDPATITETEPRVRLVSFDHGPDDFEPFDSFADFVSFVADDYEELLAAQEEVGEMTAEDEQLLATLANLLGPMKEKVSAEPDPAPEPTPEDSAGGGGVEDLLAAALAPEPEPEPEPTRVSPEVERATALCHTVVQKLLDAELVELVMGAGIREDLENYLLIKLMRARDPEDAMDSWIYALTKAREVEELYGTDDQLKAKMAEAFEEAYAAYDG